MIGVVIPAHNEQACLPACLRALRKAALAPALGGEAVSIIVVLDRCSDRSRAIVAHHTARKAPPACRIGWLEVEAGNVGVARAAGADRLLADGARWLAFTDADTRVSPEWLVMQLRQEADVVCGSIGIDDWSPHGAHGIALHEHFLRTYDDNDGHRHIHGANLGVSAEAYRRAGGFAPLACHEDVALVAALERTGASFAWSAAPRVATSARTDARARGGFGDTLLAVVAARAALQAHTVPPLILNTDLQRG
jgi:glycosyltransferase involved in cell wall biosynthesis